MKRLALALLAALALWSTPSPAQQPITLPANTLYGRLGVGPGPGQAIPFATIAPLIGSVTGPGATTTIGAIPTWGNTLGTQLGTGILPGALNNCMVSNGTSWLSSTCPGSSALLASNNIWTGNNFFKSGSPWFDVKAFGAVGDGVTNDTVAVQAAINAIPGGVGGTVYFPPGTYCVNGGVTVTTQATRLVASSNSNGGTILSACGAAVTPLNLNAFSATLEHLFIVGQNSITAANPALLLGTGCTECFVTGVRAVFGSNAIKITGNDMFLLNVHAESSYGGAIVYATGSAYYQRVKLDQNYPVSIPPAGTTPAAWQALHAYTTGTIVSTGGFYIQATNNGTSAAGAPTPPTYGTGVSDGTVVWNLVAPVTFYALQLDTGVSLTTVFQGDLTGPYIAGIGITNTLAGVAPATIFITDTFFGESWVAGISATNGRGLFVKGSQFTNCVNANCAGIQTSTGNWLGDVSIVNSEFFGNAIGINLAAGTNTVISNNTIVNSSTAGVFVQAGVTKFAITDNNIGSSATYGANTIGIGVAAGASNFYTISGNITNGAGTEVSDGGTGASKIVQVNANRFGTNTNDSAAAGAIGELLSSTVLVGSAVALVTGTPKDVTSLALTAGDWDVSGTVCFNPNAATTMNNFWAWISPTTATPPTAPNNGAFYQVASAYGTGQPACVPTGTGRVSIATTTTHFLSTLAGFGVNTLSAFGVIRARRVR